MKLSILTSILAVSSCCSDEELPSLNDVRPRPMLETAENAIVADPIIDSKEKPDAVTSSVKNEAKIVGLRKYLGEVQAELKSFPEVQKFHCRIEAEPIPDEYVMTENEKESFRQAGFDPDAIAKKANENMAVEREERKRWKDLKKTEEEILFLLDFVKNESR